jgi:hypothetical protein
MKQVSDLGYYTTKNFIICTGHLVLLAGPRGRGSKVRRKLFGPRREEVAKG